MPRLFWGTYVKRTFISAAAILAFAATAHADELTDIQAQAKQLREQNATMTKRLADIEKRQKALEAQKTAVPTINPVDAMAADLPYKAAVKAKPVENDDICVKGICVYGNFDMGLTYIQHSAAVCRFDRRSARYAGLAERRPRARTSAPAPTRSAPRSSVCAASRRSATISTPCSTCRPCSTRPSGMNANGTVHDRPEQRPAVQQLCQNSFGNSSKGGQMFNNAAYFG